MTISRHTPGPWAIKCGDDGVTTEVGVAGRRGSHVTVFKMCKPYLWPENPYAGGEAEMLANARLIAAAPELLAAAQRILKMLDIWAHPDKNGGVDYLRAAIAKATGQEQQQGQDARP